VSEGWIQTVASILVGFIAGWWFARRSSEELLQHVRGLRRLVNALATSLHKANIIRATFTKDGELVEVRPITPPPASATAGVTNPGVVVGVAPPEQPARPADDPLTARAAGPAGRVVGPAGLLGLALLLYAVSR
jgi:hypothetical protein